jgi:hypothetical protein
MPLLPSQPKLKWLPPGLFISCHPYLAPVAMFTINSHEKSISLVIHLMIGPVPPLFIHTDAQPFIPESRHYGLIFVDPTPPPHPVLYIINCYTIHSHVYMLSPPGVWNWYIHICVDGNKLFPVYTINPLFDKPFCGFFYLPLPFIILRVHPFGRYPHCAPPWQFYERLLHQSAI